MTTIDPECFDRTIVALAVAMQIAGSAKENGEATGEVPWGLIAMLRDRLDDLDLPWELFGTQNANT